VAALVESPSEGRFSNAEMVMSAGIHTLLCLILTGVALTTAHAEPLVVDSGRADVRFAAIGDFGTNSSGEARVAALVHSWHPDFVVTVGDNNYPAGSAATIDVNIGKYYHDFIAPYAGRYGAGAATNRFFPALGNHDWAAPGAAPYLAYFGLPGNERYYSVRSGPVQLFIVDSDPHEPDGIDRESVQARWLQTELAASTARQRIVVFHHPAFGSGEHGSNAALQWPFRAWGATAVLCGHDHDYERIDLAGMPYVVVGTGGAHLVHFRAPIDASEIRLAKSFGALLVEADAGGARASYVTADGQVADTFAIPAAGDLPAEHELIGRDFSWSYFANGATPGPDWRSTAFDATTWPAGPAPLGFGEGGEATLIAPAGATGPVTTYFRHEFAAATPAFGWLQLGLRADDAEIAYLNGVEVARLGLPARKLVSANSHGSKSVEPAAEPASSHQMIDPNTLEAGANVLAVELHRDTTDGAEFVFGADLVGFAAPLSLVPREASWSYWDAGSAPASDWMHVGFDDSAWASGPAPLGWGQTNLSTQLHSPVDRPGAVATTYFRTAFTVSDAGTIRGLLSRAWRDSGAIVYLNGAEVARWNLPAGTVAPDELATKSVKESARLGFVEVLLAPSALVSGRNELAIEVHPTPNARRPVKLELSLVGISE
jgi:tartrate-resistant acid phosphatase type 5